jgi:hypothetical protein
MILKVLRISVHQRRNTLKDPSPDDMEIEKILAVDTGQDTVHQEIKYVQDDVVQEETAVTGSIPQVEEMKRCTM